MIVTKLSPRVQPPRQMLAIGLLLWAITMAIWQVYFCIAKPHSNWLDAWLSPDQQAYRLFKQGRYAEAAQRFERADWQATAYYAAENFSSAGVLWGRQSGYQALFFKANALAHLERYQAAIDHYQLSLLLQPDNQAAQENLALVVALSKTPEAVADVSGDPRANLDADEIVFADDDSERMQHTQETASLDGDTLSSKEIQALWMRRLPSNPADFLALKFRYQLEAAKQ